MQWPIGSKQRPTFNTPVAFNNIVNTSMHGSSYLEVQANLSNLATSLKKMIGLDRWLEKFNRLGF